MKTQKGSGSHKIGRHKEKCHSYQADKTREKNKLKRLLRSNGRTAAEAYALKWNLSLYLHQLTLYRNLPVEG